MAPNLEASYEMGTENLIRWTAPDHSPVGIDGCDAAPTPTRFAQIVSDNFPVLHQVPGNRTHDYASDFECEFEFEKGRQLLICFHNKASSVAALGGHNPKLSAPVIRT